MTRVLHDLFVAAVGPRVAADPDASAAALRGFLERAWSRETAHAPERWCPERPSQGQCAVTSVIAQKIFGGDIVRATGVSGGTPVTHYWLFTVLHGPLDLTADQFAVPPAWDHLAMRRPSDLLSQDAFRARADHLEEALSAVLIDAVAETQPA